jgi:hypothetical protein
LAQPVCRDGLNARYLRLPKRLAELAKGDGRDSPLMKALVKTDLGGLDDFGLVPLRIPAKLISRSGPT